MQYQKYDSTITVEAEGWAWDGADLLCPACVDAYRERWGDSEGLNPVTVDELYAGIHPWVPPCTPESPWECQRCGHPMAVRVE